REASPSPRRAPGTSDTVGGRSRSERRREDRPSTARRPDRTRRCLHERARSQAAYEATRIEHVSRVELALESGHDIEQCRLDRPPYIKVYFHRRRSPLDDGAAPLRREGLAQRAEQIAVEGRTARHRPAQRKLDDTVPRLRHRRALEPKR